MNLDTLPEDVFLDVARFLEIVDILSLRKTSRGLCELTRSRSLWIDVLLSKIVHRNIPIPCCSIQTLSALSTERLERLAVRALLLRLNWTSPRPQVKSRTSFKIDMIDAAPDASSKASQLSLRCLALYFLPGRGNKYLITLARRDKLRALGPPAQRSYEVQCWYVSTSEEEEENSTPGNLSSTLHSKCIATYSCAGLLAACVNADPTHHACLTLTQHIEPSVGHAVTTFALSIDFDSLDCGKGFIQYSSFPSFQTAVRLEGSVFFATDESHEIRVINVDTGRLMYSLAAPLFNADPTIYLEEYRPVNSLIVGHFALIFRQQWIHLYHLPDLHHSSLSGDSVKVQPVASHKWRWRIDTLDAVAQRPHPLLAHLYSSAKTAPRPAPDVCLLLRFASMFPWPVNILHHFILPPNPAFATSADDKDVPSPDILPYLYLSSSSTEPPALLALQPYMVTSIPSPVRIFTPSDVALGPYGTALWLDAQTDASVVLQAGDRGQRIAGRVLRFPPRPSNIDIDGFPTHAVDLVGANAGAPEDGYIAEEELEANVGPQQVRGHMVFHIQEDNEDWGRVAMCEEEGRIAVGTVDGVVDVYGYG